MGGLLSTRRGGGAPPAPLAGQKRAQPSESGGMAGNDCGADGGNDSAPPAKRAAASPQPASAGGAAADDDDAAEPPAAAAAASPPAAQPAVVSASPRTRGAASSARRAAEAFEAKFWPSRLTHAEAVSNGGQLLRDTLSANGFCVVTGAVPDDATLARWRADLRRLLAAVALGDDAAAATGAVDALFAASLDDSAWPRGVSIDGVFDGYGAGHVAAAWEARLHPRLRAVFAALWRTRRLAVSLDGFAADRPRAAPQPQPTLHSDENPHGPGASDDAVHAVQGALSLTATAPETGGTTVVLRSHKFHRELLTRFSAEADASLRDEPNRDWHELSDAEQDWLLRQPGCELRRVATAPGDLLLWDSRTVHSGRRASAPLPADAWRFALFLCYWPAAWLDAAARGRKAAAMGVDAATGRPLPGARPESTSHWPDGRELKPRFGWPQAGEDWADPWTRARPAGARSDGVVKLPPVARSKAALRLAGVVPYGDDSDADDDEATCAWMAAADD